MNKHLILIMTGALLFTAFLGTVSGADGEIFRTDPTGDVFTSGTVGDEVDDVDIIQLRIVYSSFPALISLRVDGEIGVGGSSTMSYSYTILVDSTGDGSEDIVITYSSLINQATIAWGDSGMEVLDPSLVTTQNGDTMSIELAEKYFSSDTVHDIAATSGVVDLTDTSSAQDGLDFNNVVDDDDTSDDDIVDDDVDDDISDDDVDDDDDEITVDPKTETPTDDSISVDIEMVSFDLDVTEDHMTVEVKVSGTTSGDVHHCSNIMVTYDENGNPEDLDDNDWEVGPDTTERMTFFGYTIEQYFKGTGDGGDDDWSEWEFYAYVDGPYDENMTLVDEDDLAEGKSAVFYLRAFSDEAETMWNQDSKDVTDEITGEGGGGDDSPVGAALIILGFIAAAGVITVFSGRRK